MCRGYRLVAEVKLKNGYLRISVSLFENLYFRNFSKRELQIISLILRLSYGYHKKTAYIKPKTWFSVCGIYQPDINKTLGGLVAKNVIRDLGNNTYSLNKNYDEWAVTYPKNFDEEKLNILKIYQTGKQNTIKNGSKSLSKDIVKHYEINKQNTTENDSNLLSDSETLTNNIVNCYTPKNAIEQNTINKNSETLPNNIVNHYKENAENEDGAIGLIGSKDNKDNKDNTNNIYNNKHFDPYFNNPVVDKFKKEYERIFNTTRCYLDAIQINKLTEISVDNPDFINKIPEILSKYKRIEFSNGINKFNLRGLINDGKWAAILNGEYDAYIRPEENSGEFDLGIPTCEVGK